MTNKDIQEMLISIYERLDRIDRKLNPISKFPKELKKMTAELDAKIAALKAQVTKNTDVEKSALVLINGVSTSLQQLKDDMAADGADVTALDEYIATLDTSANDLAAAVTANTPAA